MPTKRLASRPTREDGRSTHPNAPGFLGIEAGGTRTTACWLGPDGVPGASATFGPANLKLLATARLRELLHDIAGRFPKPVAVGIGMAGARTAADRERIAEAAAGIWPGVALAITHDLEVALAAAGPRPEHPRVLVLSGTGSCCYGQDARGRSARTGGWGHLLGDQGSGYDIAITALRAAIETRDLTGAWGPLGQGILAHLQLNEPDQLVGWIHDAAKGAVAALAPVVFRTAARGDRLARRTLRHAAEALASAAVACARNLASPRERMEFVLAGGVLLGERTYEALVRGRLRAAWPGALVSRLQASGAVGAALLARDRVRSSPSPSATTPPRVASLAPSNRHASGTRTEGDSDAARVLPRSAGLSPTEMRHPDSMNLDRLSASDAVDLMLREDARIPAAIRKEKPGLLKALRCIRRALSSGGRLFYVGAGTSGRLGILDASECPPTFRTPPEWVQGIIAGGVDAVFRAVEGAEDDFDAGRRAVEARGVTRRDVVLGIAASGRTPFVWGALEAARERAATTGLLCFHPDLRFAPGHRPDIVIAPRLGPEVLTGSTRLKAGTATKLVLNVLTTLTMVRLGKVVSNLMVDLNPANAKLRDRAIRITRELTGADADAARGALERNGWIVKAAIASLGRRERRAGSKSKSTSKSRARIARRRPTAQRQT